LGWLTSKVSVRGLAPLTLWKVNMKVAPEIHTADMGSPTGLM